MKKFIIGKCMNLIRKETDYDEEKLAEIEYGLVSIYLTFSKLIVITILALILGIFKEMIVFLLMYNIIRMPSFGIHATKSWICLLVSTIGFIGIPLLCIYVRIPLIIKLIGGIICVVLMFKNSPADTKKRPIVNPKRRLVYKILSGVIAIIYVVLSLVIKDSFISNSLILGLMLQNIVISPLTYKVFKQPFGPCLYFPKIRYTFL